MCQLSKHISIKSIHQYTDVLIKWMHWYLLIIDVSVHLFSVSVYLFSTFIHQCILHYWCIELVGTSMYQYIDASIEWIHRYTNVLVINASI